MIETRFIEFAGYLINLDHVYQFVKCHKSNSIFISSVIGINQYKEQYEKTETMLDRWAYLKSLICARGNE